jgi:hypothetical protein
MVIQLCDLLQYKHGFILFLDVCGLSNLMVSSSIHWSGTMFQLVRFYIIQLCFDKHIVNTTALWNIVITRSSDITKERSYQPDFVVLKDPH